ncbi:MAG: ATP-binding protein [Saprospiraceae bacterium]|nr:ATP-binding protein [Bacteroidia bacterium]NNL91136.1 ATP-binding protein [Saprospiraceae bacterium]
MPKTILITGPESSGKSTLAQYLSKAFNFDCINEYAREYLESAGHIYTQDDILSIAKGHFLLINQLPETSFFILDTYLLNLKIWSNYKYGYCHPWINEQLQKFKPAITFLLKPNIPWVEDPLRESPFERQIIFKIYEKELTELKWPYYIIDAQLIERNSQAEHILKEFLDLKLK